MYTQGECKTLKLFFVSQNVILSCFCILLYNYKCLYIFEVVCQAYVLLQIYM